VALAGRRWDPWQVPFWGGQTGPNPTDRGKNGVKRSILVEAHGWPLGVVIAGANVHDEMLLADTIEAAIVSRPRATAQHLQHIALDAGYDNPTGWKTIEHYHYQPHMPCLHKDQRHASGDRRHHPPRRWVVERTLSWLSKCRAILVRYAKLPSVYLGLIKLACILLWYRRLHRLRRLKGF
jgi:putative transposase